MLHAHAAKHCTGSFVLCNVFVGMTSNEVC